MAVKIALAGNPNCGKTTLFNALTGSNQFVGNWPGVTVEKKEGKLKGHKDVTIMDLPGIYSLSPYTLEEVVARNYLIGERPDAIINIVDGTNIERNLYLSTQIMELGIPVIMAVNMVDILEKTGEKVHIDKLSQKLGCEVVEISALKGTGITKAAEKAVALAQQKGVYSIGYNSDMSKEAPEACLCSVIWNWSAYYTSAVQSVIDGTWDGSNYYGGMNENLVSITPIADFAAAATKEKVNMAKQQILSGKNGVFDGVIKTNTGAEVGTAGKTLEDSVITGGINWYFKTVKVIE